MLFNSIQQRIAPLNRKFWFRFRNTGSLQTPNIASYGGFTTHRWSRRAPTPPQIDRGQDLLAKSIIRTDEVINYHSSAGTTPTTHLADQQPFKDSSSSSTKKSAIIGANFSYARETCFLIGCNLVSISTRCWLPKPSVQTTGWRSGCPTIDYSVRDYISDGCFVPSQSVIIAKWVSEDSFFSYLCPE